MEKKNRSTNNSKAGTPPDPQGEPPRQQTGIPRKLTRFFYLLFLLAALASGFFWGRKSDGFPLKHPAESNGTGTVKLKPGPWGDLQTFPITISPPLEVLKVRGNEGPLKWFFRGYSRDNLAKLLGSLEMTASQREQLLDPGSLKVTSKGIEITPSSEVIFSLSPGGLRGLYGALGEFDENDFFRDAFLSEDLDALEGKDISKQSVSLIKKVSCPSGRHLICYCTPFVLSKISDYGERVSVAKALTRQKSMLLRLKITPHSNINALTVYWGRAFLVSSVRTLLESIQKTPEGGEIGVITLLPPMPKSLLYTYALPQSTSNGETERRGGYWTSFNFFRDPPDPHFSEIGFISEKLKTEYYPIQSDPLYGDVICFAKPGGTIVHSAVYIADNIAYTKNGDAPWHPWMYSTLEDLTDIYSAGLPPGQTLTLQYFRNKYY